MYGWENADALTVDLQFYTLQELFSRKIHTYGYT